MIHMEYEQRRLQMMQEKWLYNVRLSQAIQIEKNAVNQCRADFDSKNCAKPTCHLTDTQTCLS